MNETKLASALRVLLSVAILAKVVLLVVYSQHLRWIMDEFGQGYWGRFVPLGLYTHVETPKTALPYPLYYAAITLGGSATNVFALWRASTATAALITIAATALSAHRVHRNATWTLFSVFVLLSFTNFLEHAFAVRNDSFAVMFTMLALAATLAVERPRWSTYGAGCLAALACLCTQKAIYGVAPVLLVLVLQGWSAGGARTASERAFRAGLGGAAVVLLYAAAFGGLDALSVIASIFLSPFKWSGHVLSAASFPGIERYVTQTLDRNLIPYALCALGLVLWLFKPDKPEQRPLAIAALMVTVAVFRHPQPWPYVFVMCMPFLSLLAPVGAGLLSRRLQTPALLALSVVLGLSFQRNLAVLSHDNTEQLRVAAQAEAMLGPHDRYFDGVGMLPTREIAGELPYWWWDGPVTDDLRAQLKQGVTTSFDTIIAQQPKVWILNYRFKRLASWINPYLERGTVGVGDVIRVSGRSIAPGREVKFRNLWPGAYHLVGRDGRASIAAAIVDGQTCPAPCAITVGEHRVAAASDQQTYLMPADVLPTGPLPITAPPFEPYEAVYDF